MEIILDDMKKRDVRFVKALYKEAFPPEERAPFFMIKNRYKRGKANMLIARLSDKPIGLAYLVEYGEIVYLFFFAVAAEERGKGYGGEILKAVIEKTRGKKLFLAREQIDGNTENNAQRISRRAFYLRNGFCDAPFKIKEAGVVYDGMTFGGCDISPEEYRALVENWAGKFALKFVDMRLFAAETDR